MLNCITIMGRLTRDPELRRTGSGIAVASFTVAVDRDFAQEGKKETDFIDCVAWRQTGEFVSKYFKKGSMIVVKGRLQIRNWNDKDGNKRKTADVVADNCYFGSTKSDSDSSNNNSGYSGNNTVYGNNRNGYGNNGTGQPQLVRQFRYLGMANQIRVHLNPRDHRRWPPFLRYVHAEKQFCFCRDLRFL